MRQSQLFPKTQKLAPKGAESVNHKLLVRAGFIDQLMTGSWTLLPLGWKVVEKINKVIREEMKAIDSQEVLMPLLHPKSIWNETGRWDKAKEVMYQFKNPRGKEFALSFTHEEIVMDLVRKHVKSYQDLPLSLFHISTKFRNELRAKSGILRGREFMMKDMYSFHESEKDMWDYYEKAKKAYSNVFEKLGFDFRITEAGGGVFTDNNTHEWQVMADGGEDTIFYCEKCDWGANSEIFKGREGNKCPNCMKGKQIKSKSIEVGNIFPFGTWYSERMRAYFTDKNGMKKPIHFASYGIGSTRVMGTWVEVSHDKDGIVWNKQISPFDVHLLSLETENKDKSKAEEINKKLKQKRIDVLFDDRDVSAGQKLSDADLIGIPVRLVVSNKTKGKIEWKERTKNKVELLTFDQVIKRLPKD